MMTPQMKSILEMNKVTNRNLQQLAKQYEEYGQDGQVTSANIKRNIQLITTNKELIDQYREEVYQHLFLYINDDDIVNRLTEDELSDEVLRELAINWNSKYLTLVDKLAGRNISLDVFVDYLKDIVAESINAKTKKDSTTEEKKSTTEEKKSTTTETESKTKTNDGDVPELESIYPDNSYFEGQPIDAEVVVIPQIETDISNIREIYFSNNAKNTVNIYGKELKDVFDLAFRNITNTKNVADAKNVLFARLTEQNSAIHERLVEYFNVYLNIFNREELMNYFEDYFNKSPSENVGNYNYILKFFTDYSGELYDKLVSSTKYINYKDVIEKQKYEIAKKEFIPRPFGKSPKTENILAKLGRCSNLVLAMIHNLLISQLAKEPDDKLIKKPVVKGKGLKSYHKEMHKYYVDKNKLNDGILEIRYQANRHLSKLKPTKITPQLAVVLRQMMMAGDIDLKDFALLSPEEQVLTKKLVRMFQLDIYLVDDKNLVKNQFELLQGERDAGNNSKVLEGKISDYQSLMNTK